MMYILTTIEGVDYGQITENANLPQNLVFLTESREPKSFCLHDKYNTLSSEERTKALYEFVSKIKQTERYV